MTGSTRLVGIALDVDGVFTDGTLWIGPSGEEYKAACFLDIMGVSRARRDGVLFALISGEDTPFVKHLARRLGIADVWVGCKNKAAAFAEFATRHGVSSRALAFMGDDINDVEAMRIAGWAAAPPSAHRDALAAAAYVARREGGRGAVRDVLDHLGECGWMVDPKGTS